MLFTGSGYSPYRCSFGHSGFSFLVAASVDSTGGETPCGKFPIVESRNTPASRSFCSSDLLLQTLLKFAPSQRNTLASPSSLTKKTLPSALTHILEAAQLQGKHHVGNSPTRKECNSPAVSAQLIDQKKMVAHTRKASTRLPV